MNNLTANLAAAQRQVSPNFALHGHIYGASAVGGPEPTNWEKFSSQPANLNLSWPGDYWQIAACGYGEYYIAQAYLNWRSGRLDFRIFDCDDTGDYTHNVHAITTFTAAGSGATPLPAMCHNTSDYNLYLFYQIPTGGIYVSVSSSISLNSSTWSAPVLLTTATVGAVQILSATYNTASNTVALLINNGANVRVIAKTGAGAWITSSPHSTTVNWQIIGITPHASGYNCYFSVVNGNFESITSHCLAIMSGSTLSSWGAIDYMNAISGDGAIHWEQQRIGPAFEGYAFVCAETGSSKSYLASGALVTNGLLQEPQFVDSISYDTRAIFFHPCNTTNLITLLISNEFAYRSYSLPAAQVGSIYEFEQSQVVKYAYDVSQGQGGEITLVLTGLQAVVVAGYWLRLTRYAYGKDGTLGGSVSLLFRLTRVRKVSNTPNQWILKGNDALGIFGDLSPRRSKTFRPSDLTLTQAVAQTFAWLGIYANGIDTPDNQFERSSWKPAESGLSFLHRLRLRENFFVVSRDEGNAPTVLIDTLQATSQMTYSITYTESTHHVHAYATESNLLDKVTSTGHALFDKESPGDGEDMHIALSDNNALTPFQNRLNRYFVNRFMSTADAILISDASAEYLSTRRVTVTIEANANLSLEPYDRITFNGADYYVFSISERWSSGSLKQRIRLAAV